MPIEPHEITQADLHEIGGYLRNRELDGFPSNWTPALSQILSLADAEHRVSLVDIPPESRGACICFAKAGWVEFFGPKTFTGGHLMIMAEEFAELLATIRAEQAPPVPEPAPVPEPEDPDAQ